MPAPNFQTIKRGDLLTIPAGRVAGREPLDVEFLGFTKADEKYSEKPEFDTLKAAMAHYGLKASADVEDVEKKLGKDYGHGIYALFKEPDGSVFSAYMFKGFWAAGSSADRVRLEARGAAKVAEARSYVPRFADFLLEVKAGRAWEGRLKRLDELLAWMYDRGILGKRDKARKDSLFRQYYRYYNDGDFPRALAAKGMSSYSPSSAKEEALEGLLEDFFKDVLSRYAGKYDRQEFRLDSVVKSVSELRERVTDGDAGGLLRYWAKELDPGDDRFDALLTELKPAYDRLQEAVSEADPNMSNTIVSAARDKMQDGGTWTRELTALYANVAAVMAKIGVVLDDVLVAAKKARGVLTVA